MATNNEIVNVLKILEAAYGRALEERTALVYLNTLDDLDAALLEQAAYHWIKAGKQFFPKVVELRETYAQVKRTPGADAGAAGGSAGGKADGDVIDAEVLDKK